MSQHRVHPDADELDGKGRDMPQNDVEPHDLDRVHTFRSSPSTARSHIPRPEPWVGSMVRVFSIQDVEQYDGDALGKVQAMISEHSVMIFGTSHCPFCIELERTFCELGVYAHVMEADKTRGGGSVLSAAKKMTRHSTVPIAFINGEFVGGCDDVKALQMQGLLQDKLAAAGQRVRQRVVDAHSVETVRLQAVPRGKAIHPLGWFPNVVNNNVVRLTGTIVTGVCAISIVFHTEPMGLWCAAGLLVDFSLRFLVGSSISPIGMTAGLLASPWKPDFKPGPPKQFASFCGVMFSLTGTAFYAAGLPLIGAIVIAMLMGAAALEGFFDFCLGCVFYGLGIRFKLFPGHVYRIYVGTREESVHTWDYENVASHAPRPEAVDTDSHSKVALKYKKRTDEWTKDDFHLVRNMQITYFAMPMALASIALAFKLAAGGGSMVRGGVGSAIRPPETCYLVLTVVAAAVFALLVVLYLARALCYLRKCRKEWACPRRSPCFCAVPLVLLLLAILCVDAGSGADAASTSGSEAAVWISRVLFWAGAGLQLLMTVAKLGEFVGKRLDVEHLHATWMMLPVGCLVAAMAAAALPVFVDGDEGEAEDVRALLNSAAFANYELARFFFAFGYGGCAVLFGITLNRIFTAHNSDNGLRHSVWIWVAAPALSAVASFQLCETQHVLFGSGGSTLEEWAECSHALALHLWFSVVLALALAWATLPYINFFGRDKFSMAYWTEGFSAAVLAAAAAAYYAVHGNLVGEVLMLVLLVVASVFVVVAFLWTAAQIYLRRSVFTPEPKWGPLALMKLTHEALRAALPNLLKALRELEAKDAETVQHFAALFVQLATVLEEHTRHEEEVIFKAFNDLFPAHAKQWNDDHAEDHLLLEQWRALVAVTLDPQLPEAERSRAVLDLQRRIPEFSEHLLEHMQGEEDHLNPIGKRYVPLEWQKQIVRSVWLLTPAARWEAMLPFVVNHLPRHAQRVRFLRALCWALPERAQQIGAVVYRNVDAVRWETLRLDLPEIIPRGAYNWRRFY